MGMKTNAVTVENSMQFPQKIKNKNTIFFHLRRNENQNCITKPFFIYQIGKHLNRTIHSIDDAVRKQDSHVLQIGIWQFLTKLQTYLPFHLAILFLGVYTEKIPPTIQKYSCTRLPMAAF